MNKVQLKHESMFLNTQGFLDENTDVWSSIPRAVSTKNDFDALLMRIRELAGIVQTPIGVTELKAKLKKVLSIKLTRIVGALLALAYEIDAMDLVNKLKLSPSEIGRLKDLEMNALVALILTLLEKYATELADYGITTEQGTELATSFDDFNELIGKPRAILNNKYTAMSMLEQVFDEVNALLNNKMDKIITMFKYSHIEFYEGYKRSRVIVDR